MRRQLAQRSFILLACLLCAIPSFSQAEQPAWWSNVVDPARLPADYAPANLGQLKWMATNAYVELEAHLPRGAGAEVEALVQGFSPTNNWSPANVGQLKATAAPFWARLIAEGYTNAYPWTESTADDTDNAIANLGQLKYVFDFHLTEDSDDDDLPDWWEIHWFGSLEQDGAGDPDYDGLSNLLEFQNGTDPWSFDTDQDGLGDGAEVNYYRTDPTNPDTDGDGRSDNMELYYGTDPLDPVSYPVTLQGIVSYGGSQSGPMRILATTNSASWSSSHLVTRSGPGSYTFFHIPNDPSYWIKAYRDVNANGSFQTWEPSGMYSESGIKFDANTGNLNIEINDSTADDDADGLLDWWEMVEFGNLSQTADGDPDADGLVNAAEYAAGTDPMCLDTDRDGLNDGDEVLTHFTNPLLVDTDGDGLSDGDEVLFYQTNPLLADSDGDGTNDQAMVSAPIVAGPPYVWFVDGEGLAEGVVTNAAIQLPIPQGTGLVRARITVFSREYPDWTDPATANDYNDQVAYYVFQPGIAPSIVFVDKDGTGLDPSSGEDDLQLMELTFEPSDLGQGVAWFTYDSDKVQLYKDDTEADTSKIDPGTESSPNWNLESGDTIPAEIYVRGLESTDEGDSFDIKFWWKKGSAEFTDKILTTVTDEVGHYAYFRGIRDHLGENQSRVYMDEIEMTGGFATGADFKLVAVRREKSTISVIDAKANNWKSIDEVKAAKSGATVIINGTFFTAPGLLNQFGQKTEGTVVNGGSEITNISEPVEADRRPAYKGYFGQKADGSISWARNTEANTVTINAAASGLAAFIPKNAGESYTDIIDEINEIHGSQYRSALAHIGYANDNAEDLVFLFFTSSATASDFPSNIDRAPLFADLVTSGASMCYGLDGSGSIGVAHRNLDGALGIVVRGNKHTWVPWRVNNYFVIDVEE